MTDGLTIEKLLAAKKFLDNIPPPPFFAQDKLLPDDRAIRFMWEGREYLGASPAFWRKVPRGYYSSSWFEIPIYNLDMDDRRRAEFYSAMVKAMHVEA